MTWSKKLHSISILLSDLHEDHTIYRVTEDLSAVAEIIVRFHTILENQLDYKKKEKEKSKKHWLKLLSH